jgi:wyosine [tRNA(Phe)-imidazoG37] synthetase (radical SAM superfamily)
MESSTRKPKYIFGPVPSRRLGRSLGIDLIPYKTCTFDCIYCDLGRTTHKTISRQPYVSPEEIRRELDLALSGLTKKPDYITLSGSGEPTLNQNIGEIVRSIKDLNSIIPLAIITNGALLFQEEVRNSLLDADVVLPSLDAVTPFLFEHINRPDPSLKMEEIISGLIRFRKRYRGQIWLEILFCRGVNDGNEEVDRFKKVIEKIQPDRVQLNTPFRPPTEDFAFPLTSNKLEQIRKKLGGKAEIISEFAVPLVGGGLDSVKDVEIRNLVKRRPCTAEDISRALGLRMDELVKHLDHLTKTGTIRYRMYQHRCYFENVLSDRLEIKEDPKNIMY